MHLYFFLTSYRYQLLHSIFLCCREINHQGKIIYAFSFHLCFHCHKSRRIPEWGNVADNAVVEISLLLIYTLGVTVSNPVLANRILAISKFIYYLLVRFVFIINFIDKKSSQSYFCQIAHILFHKCSSFCVLVINKAVGLCNMNIVN